MTRFQAAVPALRRAQGFTLIEMLVVVAILGILSAIAYPAYTGYVVRGNRAAAQSYMLDLALAETQMLVDSRTYGAKSDLVGVPEPARVTQYYDVTIDPVNTAPQTFVITATPKSSTMQKNDPVLTLNQAGAKTPSDKW